MTTCAANIPFAHSVRTLLLVGLRASVPRFACSPLGAVVAQIYRPYPHTIILCTRRRASNRSDDQQTTLSRVKRPTARATIPRTQSAPNSRLRRAPPSRACSTIGRKCHLYATCTSFIVLVPFLGFLHVNTQKEGTEARAVTPRPAGPGRPGGRLAGGSGGETAIG